MYRNVVDMGYVPRHDAATTSGHADETTVMLISDHGFHSTTSVQFQMNWPRKEHRDYGIFCNGPDIKAGHQIEGVNLLTSLQPS